MSPSELKHLLQTGPTLFKAIHVVWTYRYNERTLDSLLKRWAQAPHGYDMRTCDPQDVDKGIRRELWWDRRIGWRVDQNRLEQAERKSVAVNLGRYWWSSNSERQEIHSNDPSLKLPKLVRSRPDTHGGTEIQRMQVVQPAFLATTHRFEAIDPTTYLGRPAVTAQAFYESQAWDTLEPYFWATADAYNLIVDSETGILLRYAAVLNGEEITTSAVEWVDYGPIDPVIFDPVAYMGTT